MMRRPTIMLLLVLIISVAAASPAIAQPQSWIGTWSSSREDFEAGERENVVLLTSGDLTLAPVSYWGNDFAASYYYTTYTNLDSPEKRVSIRFVAQASKTISGIMTYLYQKGVDIVWRFRLETDNNGEPSGQLAWDGAWQTRGITSSKWWTVDLISQGTLTAGEVYHLVISYENLLGWGVPSSDNYINIRSLWPLNSKWINGAETNENRGVLIYDGSNWVEYQREPVYVLQFTDGTYEGNPYYTVRSSIDDVGVYENNVKGEQFTQPVTREISAVELYVRRRGNPADNLYVVLWGAAEGVMSEASIGNATTISDSWGWVSTAFEEPLVLIAGRIYILYLKSPGSSRENRYDVNLLGTYTTSPYPSLTYDGTNSFYVYSTTGGLTWGYHRSRRDDIAFRFPAAHSEQGIFTSRVFDAGSKVSWENISWSASVPDNTGLTIQTRSSDDNQSWSGWENENEGSITSPAARYFQYRVLLGTANPSVSPVLREVKVTYRDISPPVVVSVTPARGQSTSDRRPTILITLSDTSGIDEGSIKLELDGQDVQFSFDPVTKQISYTPAEDLPPGLRTVYLSASDLGGNPGEESWSFTVVEAEKPWQPQPWVIAVVVVGIAVAGLAALLVKRRRQRHR